MEKYEFRTDLACERFKPDENEKETEYREETVGCVTINEIEIKSETAKEKHGMRKGKYSTLHFPALYDVSDFESEEISSVLEKLLRKFSNSGSFYHSFSPFSTPFLRNLQKPSFLHPVAKIPLFRYTILT